MSYLLVSAIAVLTAGQAQLENRPAASSGAGNSLQPSQVRLEFDNHTLVEIADGVSAQGPSSVVVRAGSVSIGPVPPKLSPQLRRFRVREPGPVTFWVAIDRVCRTTSSWPWVESAPAPAGREAVPRVVLSPASPDAGFVCNDGAFRIVVTNLFYARNIVLAPPFLPAAEPVGRSTPSDSATFAAELVVMAEPRLRIQRVGNLKIRRAIDDLGHNLMPASPEGKQPPNVPAGVISVDGSSIWLPIALAYPEDPGKLITRLAGRVSADISGRAAGAHPVVTEVAFDFTGIPMP
jgi:hypothetical protein